MAKKTIDDHMEKAVPKTWKKLILIQTGEGYVSPGTAERMSMRAIYDIPPVEEKLFETTDLSAVAMVEALQKKDEEIEALKSVIREFKAAQEMVMRAAE